MANRYGDIINIHTWIRIEIFPATLWKTVGASYRLYLEVILSLKDEEDGIQRGHLVHNFLNREINVAKPSFYIVFTLKV